MAMHVQIRRGAPRDFDALGAVFHAAVHDGAGQYSPRQRAAWTAHLRAQHVWLAETDGRAFGFMTLTPAGYVDFAYIPPAAQGQGLFRRLCEQLETDARALCLVRLWTDASLHAKAPFEAVGFVLSYPETVTRGGERLKRFRMEKILNA